MGLHLHALTFSACDCAISSLWHVENASDRRIERCPPRNMWTNCSNLMQKEWVKLNNTVESIPSPFETGWDEYLCGTGMGEWIDEPRDLVVDHYTSEIIIPIIAQWRWMIWPGKYRKDCPVVFDVIWLFQGGYPGFAPTMQALETSPFDVFWSFPITNTTLGSFMRFKWIVRLSWWPTRWRSGLLDFGCFEPFFGWFWMCFLDTNHPKLCFRATVLPCWPPPATTWGATTRRHGASTVPCCPSFLVISGRSENSMVPWAIWDELSN